MEQATNSGPSAPGTHRRVVLVTGAGTGIGRATAHAFAAEGVRVLAVGRRPGPLAETAVGDPILLAAGLTLADVHCFTPCLDGDMTTAAPSPEGLRIARERLAVIDERIAAQTAARNRLAQALESVPPGPA
ncbi:SDR family NAD(P)-dependent oxidoreductase [Streptomyces libani]|uniref:SDR family NAD(P)-dependent oxidoreductase n=1 Tax=Streptomyces nigrescens TaxID=1920 RepID=UPI00381B2BAF